MGKYLKDVMQRAKEIRAAVDQGLASDSHQRNMATVEALLAQENCFLKMEPQVSGSLLLFLGYPEEKLFEILTQLVFEQSTEGRYIYIDPDWIDGGCGEDPETDPEPEDTPSAENEPETEESPKEEKQDRFFRDKFDQVFKMDAKSRFYLLTDGQWVDCPPLRHYYFDAASEYWEIEDPLRKAVPKKRSCPKCGAPQEEDYLFCVKCGADLQKSYCRHCGKQLPKDANFCPYCGQKR